MAPIADPTTPFTLALVTGASSGIGEALCYLLAEKKINLIISGRNAARLEELAKSLSTKVQVTPIVADLAVSADRERLVTAIHAYAPNLVINNAGFGLYGNAIDYATNQQLEILTVNGNALLELTLEAAKSMKEQNKKGIILNVASVAACYVFPSLAVYSAAKTFVVQLSQALDFELKPQGIRVLVACPGMVATGFSRRAAGKPQPVKRLSMTADYAADQIWRQIEKRQSCHLFDWRYRWGTFASKLVPKSWMAYLLQSDIKKRTKAN